MCRICPLEPSAGVCDIEFRMSKTDEGYVLVSPFIDDVETQVIPEKETKKVEDTVEIAKEEAPSKKEAPSKD